MTHIGNTAADCRLYAINFVPRIDYATICTCQFQCYVSKDHKAQFQPIFNTTTELTSLVGRVFDGTTEAWSDYQKDYAGKTLYLQNNSAAELTVRGTDSANGKWLCTVHMGWREEQAV